MGEVKIPTTVAECAGTGEEINLLEPHLHVTLRPKREILIATDMQSDDLDSMGTPEIYLGTKAGRGVDLLFKDFDALGAWVSERAGLQPKLEPYAEEEIYVPEDNPDDEELARRAEDEAAASEGSET
jgi:hypothetical protein